MAGAGPIVNRQRQESGDQQGYGPRLATGVGGLDWDGILCALAQVGYTGPWTFEAAQSRHGESREEMARMSREVAKSWE